MNGQFVLIVCLYVGLVGLLALLAGLGLPTAVAVPSGVRIASVLLAVQLFADVVSLLRGHRPEELYTHLGYAVISVVLFPLLTSRSDEAPERSDHFVTVVAAVGVIVVCIRMFSTWSG